MLGDDRFRKVAARVVVDDKNVEGTYASDSVAAVAQSAIAALVLFLVLIMMLLIRLDVGRSRNGRSSSALPTLQLGASLTATQPSTVDGLAFK